MVSIKYINLSDEIFDGCIARATNDKGDRVPSYDMFLNKRYDEICLCAINEWHTNQNIIEIIRNQKEIKIIYQE